MVTIFLLAEPKPWNHSCHVSFFHTSPLICQTLCWHYLPHTPRIWPLLTTSIPCGQSLLSSLGLLQSPPNWSPWLHPHLATVYAWTRSQRILLRPKSNKVSPHRKPYDVSPLPWRKADGLTVAFQTGRICPSIPCLMRPLLLFALLVLLPPHWLLLLMQRRLGPT